MKTSSPVSPALRFGVFELDPRAKALDELMRRSKSAYVSPSDMAYIYVGMGDLEGALSSLEQAYTERDQYMIYLKVDPKFDQFHSEPRFQALLRGIGLSD